MVTISLIADACKHGTFNRGFTLYVLPIQRELGIGVAAISLADMLGRLEGAVLGPVMGYLTESGCLTLPAGEDETTGRRAPWDGETGKSHLSH